MALLYILRKTSVRQAVATTKSDPKSTDGRAAQRRRTRRAIVDAAAKLLSAGKSPTAADVSRRTVYMYFPTLEQLLVDAALGSMSRDTVDVALDALDAAGVVNVEQRVDALAR